MFVPTTTHTNKQKVGILAMPFSPPMLGDIIVLVLLPAASPLIVTLSSGLLVLRFFVALGNCLGSVVSHVLRCLPSIMSPLLSQISPKDFRRISLSPNTLQLGFRPRPLSGFPNMGHDITVPLLVPVSEI